MNTTHVLLSMSKKKLAIVLIGIIDIIAIIFACMFYFDLINQKVNNKEIIAVESNEVIENKNTQEERQLWINNKAINNDYIGEIKFDSGLINKSFVQAKDVYDLNGEPYKFYTEYGQIVFDVENYNGNDVYIWTNWKDMSYDYNILGGSIFMDYRNNIDDENIIIYGHHFSETSGNDPDRNKAFTPLEKLFEEENYEENKSLKLILDNCTYSYVLAGVYKYDVFDDYYIQKLQYYRTHYNYDEFNDVKDDNYYSNYIEAFNNVRLYDTGVDLNTNDKTLTLQTCISGHDGELYEICVFKLINIEYFDE